MNGASRGCGRNARYDRRDQRFYVSRLYLYVDAGTSTDCLQHLLEGGKADAGSDLEMVELRKRNRPDGAPGDGRIDRWRKQRIVMDDNGSIACRMNVQLDAVGARI